MSSKASLRSAYAALCREYESIDLEAIGRFFQHTLQVGPATRYDIISELMWLRDAACTDLDRISGLYQYLQSHLAWNEEAVSELRLVPMLSQLLRFHSQESCRSLFDRIPAIFVTTATGHGWYSTPECLWSSATGIRGKVTLNDQYESLKKFFVDILGVNTLTAQMVCDELLKSDPNTNPGDVKAMIWSLNSLLQSHPDDIDPAPLLKARIFPTRHANDSVILSSAATDFAIGDREYLTTRFQPKARLLDYSLEEVHQLRPFFDWTHLGNRYLSAASKEITSVSEETECPIAMLDRDLKRKAYALLR